MSKITIANNHILIDVQTNLGRKTCVVDTGCPITFFFEEDVNELYLHAGNHAIFSFKGEMCRNITHKADVARLIGTPIDGFLGADIMQRYGGVLFDLRNEQISFGATDYTPTNTIPMQNLCGLPMFNVSFNGRETLTAFDSGARYSFVSSSFAQEIALATTYDTKEDHHPGSGWFDIHLHHGDIMVGNNNLGPHTIATSDYYDNVLEMMGLKAFIGIDTLRNVTIILSYARKEVTIIYN